MRAAGFFLGALFPCLCACGNVCVCVYGVWQEKWQDLNGVNHDVSKCLHAESRMEDFILRKTLLL